MDKVNSTELKKLDELANLWNKSRDEKYRVEWYQLIKKLAAQLPSRSSVSAVEQSLLRKQT